jgi:hypothetical protein
MAFTPTKGWVMEFDAASRPPGPERVSWRQRGEAIGGKGSELPTSFHPLPGSLIPFSERLTAIASQYIGTPRYQPPDRLPHLPGKHDTGR